jgi:isopentenyl phosphate kinase
MSELTFVKLGGSIITQKAEPNTARQAVIARLASEVRSAITISAQRAGSEGEPLHIVLGHGSGSFGHVVARQYGTHQGARTQEEWRGFAEVAAAAARLNRIVTDSFLAAGVPAWALQPSASARCRAGDLRWLEIEPVQEALARGLVPLLYGDVALDEVQGSTIVSTEQIFAYLARQLRPVRILLIGQVDGVFAADPLREPEARPVPEISSANWGRIKSALSGSHATDVTGGMLAKVEMMVDLARELPELTIHILSGESAGALEAALLSTPESCPGTRVRW